MSVSDRVENFALIRKRAGAMQLRQATTAGSDPPSPDGGPLARSRSDCNTRSAPVLARAGRPGYGDWPDQTKQSLTAFPRYNKAKENSKARLLERKGRAFEFAKTWKRMREYHRHIQIPLSQSRRDSAALFLCDVKNLSHWAENEPKHRRKFRETLRAPAIPPRSGEQQGRSLSASNRSQYPHRSVRMES